MDTYNRDDAFADSRPFNPWTLVGIGAGLGLIVVSVAGSGDFPDWLVLAVAALASLLGSIGSIGVGVAIGIRYADHLRGP